MPLSCCCLCCCCLCAWHSSRVQPPIPAGCLQLCRRGLPARLGIATLRLFATAEVFRLGWLVGSYKQVCGHTSPCASFV